MVISTFQRACSAAVRDFLPGRDIRFIRKSGDRFSSQAFYAGTHCGLVYGYEVRDSLTTLFLTRLVNGQLLYPFGEDLSGVPDAVNALDLFPIYGAMDVESQLNGKDVRERLLVLTRCVGEHLGHVLEGDFADFAEIRKLMQWRRSTEGRAYGMEQGKAALRSLPGIGKILDARLLEPDGTPVLSTAELYRKLGIPVHSAKRPTGNAERRQKPRSTKKS